MADRLVAQTVLRMLIRTILLSWFGVMGLTISLCDTMTCGCRVLCAMVGMSCGCALFLQIVCAQLVLYFSAASQTT